VASKPLLFSDVTRRLQAVGYQLQDGPDGLRTFTKTILPHFPYVEPRYIAFPVDYDDDELLPTEVVENIVLHLFLTCDEDNSFWANEKLPN
jgi:hypothetical protein